MIRCFLNDIDLCHLRLGVLAPWVIVKCKSHFSILGKLSFYFSSFLRFLLILVKNVSYFSVAVSEFMAGIDVSHFRWSILAPWDLVKYKSHFSFFDDITKYLVIFFIFLNFLADSWYFLRFKDDFGYLVLILVYLTGGGGLDRFFRPCYHTFPWVTTCYHSCYNNVIGVLHHF